MFQVFPRVDHKKVISSILEKRESLKLPPLNLNNYSVKLLTFRRSGLHSLLNFMVISDGQPSIVIKVPRYQGSKFAVEALKNEFNILSRLAQEPEKKVLAPQVFGLFTVDQVPALIMKAYPGPMLHSLLDKETDPSRLNQLIAAGAKYLSELRSSQQVNIKIDQVFIDNLIFSPLRSICEYYPNYINEIESFLDKFLALPGFQGMVIPMVLQHNEYNPWNMLLPDELHPLLLDWEDATDQGLPFLDLLNYFTVCFRILFVGETAEAKQRGSAARMERANILLSQFLEIGKKYCEAMGLPVTFLDLFYVIFAIQTTRFFISDKRKEINYGRSWISMLLISEAKNCFEQYIKKEISA